MTLKQWCILTVGLALALCMVAAPASAQVPTNPPYKVQPGNGIDVSTSPTKPVVSAKTTVHSEATTTYTAASTDCASTVKLTNAAAVTVTLPIFTAGCSIDFVDTGAGGMTINGSGGALINGAASISEAQYVDAYLLSDGTNYNQLLAPSVGASTPCTTTANSVQYDNAGAFGCVTPLTFNGTGLVDATTGAVALQLSGAPAASASGTLMTLGATITGGGASGGNWLGINCGSTTGDAIIINSAAGTNLANLTCAGIGVFTQVNVSGSNGVNSPSYTYLAGGSSTHTNAGASPVNGTLVISQSAGACAPCDLRFGGQTSGSIGADANGTVLTFGLDQAAAGVAAGGSVIFSGILQQSSSTVVASLPTCNTAARGTEEIVTDAAASPSWGGTAAGSGTLVEKVICNGTNWTYH